MQKRYLISIVLLLVISAILLFFMSRNWRGSTIAYVNSAEVLQNYKGMLEAREKISELQREGNAKLDTLLEIYNKGVMSYTNDKNLLSANELKEKEFLLRNMEKEISAIEIRRETEIEDLSEKYIQGALNQVNSYVESYALEHNIDLVIGLTDNGNILYAGKRVDITEKIIKELNESYE